MWLLLLLLCGYCLRHVCAIFFFNFPTEWNGDGVSFETVWINDVIIATPNGLQNTQHRLSHFGCLVCGNIPGCVYAMVEKTRSIAIWVVMGWINWKKKYSTVWCLHHSHAQPVTAINWMANKNRKRGGIRSVRILFFFGCFDAIFIESTGWLSQITSIFNVNVCLFTHWLSLSPSPSLSNVDQSSSLGVCVCTESFVAPTWFSTAAPKETENFSKRKWNPWIKDMTP